MKPNTAPQKASEPERKQCGHCFILMATHEQGMVTKPAVMDGDTIVVPATYYHSWHAPREPAVPISAALHDPASLQPASASLQA
jgi:hypothetical protein